MPKGRIENLIRLDTEKAREIGKKGGAARAKQIKEQKTMAEMLKIWSNRKTNSNNIAALHKAGFSDEDTNKAVLLLPLLKQCNKGDMKAYSILLKLIGEDKQYMLEVEKLKNENKLLKEQIKNAKAQAESNNDKSSIEDLTPLADMLKTETEEENDGGLDE